MQKFDLERANTDRVSNLNVKKSVLSLNLNQINMNQVRNQARQSLVLINNVQVPGLRKIQTERKLGDDRYEEVSEQHLPSNNEVLD